MVLEETIAAAVNAIQDMIGCKSRLFSAINNYLDPSNANNNIFSENRSINFVIFTGSTLGI